jgi:hypothetical protein
MAVGLLLLAAPGPGLIVCVIGAGLIAQESLYAARALDWAEPRIRNLVAWSLGVWRRSSAIAKVVLVLFVVAVGAAVAYGAYTLMLASSTASA